MYGSVVIDASGIHYYRRFRERGPPAARRTSALELVRAELQALRNQLNPHLLFNALNSVAALMHEDVQAADDMLGDLAHLLRVYLSGDERQEDDAEAFREGSSSSGVRQHPETPLRRSPVLFARRRDDVLGDDGPGAPPPAARRERDPPRYRAEHRAGRERA